ncbi:hypothetical protein [Meiothermus granaticius]|nr:hypothetical protein [Meiothermus granaticius]
MKTQIAVSVLGFTAVCAVIAVGFLATTRIIEQKADQLSRNIDNLPANLVRSVTGAVGMR